MKYLINILIGLFITILSIAQDHKTYLAGKLIPECPPVLDSIQLDFETKIDSYISIKTGVDSLKILFGEASQGIYKAYWSCQIINDTLKSFGGFSLDMDEENGRLSKVVGIMDDAAYQLISLKIEHDPETNEIYYVWLKNNKGSKVIPKTKIKRNQFKKQKQYNDAPPFPIY
jgi:hypothetical protein